MDSGHARSQPFSPMGTQHSGYRRWLRSADRLAGNAAAARLRRRIDRRCLTAPRAASRDQISMAHDIAYSPIAADPLLLEALRNKLDRLRNEAIARFRENLRPETLLVALRRSADRAEEHTSELQSLMRISYA